MATSEDERWMRAALREAEAALSEGEVPVGAVVVRDGRIIGRGHNRVEGLNDPTAHAEILAIGAACDYVGSWRLDGCTIYVTLEPCPMCAGALVLSRIDRLVFGAHDPKKGACGSLMDIVRDGRLNHTLSVSWGVLEGECGSILSGFFEGLRSGEA